MQTLYLWLKYKTYIRDSRHKHPSCKDEFTLPLNPWIWNKYPFTDFTFSRSFKLNFDSNNLIVTLA